MAWSLIAVGLGCLAGYGLARSQFRGKDHVSFWIISTRMAPIAAVVLPLFVIFRGTGLLGIYALGLGVPFLLSAIFIERSMTLMSRIKRHMGLIERVSGVLLIVVGVMLLTGWLSIISWWVLENVPVLGLIG